MPPFPSWVGPRLAVHLHDIMGRQAQQLDHVGMATGPEGNGKSTLLAHKAALTDPTFMRDPLSRFAYSGKELIKIGNDLEPGRAVIWDEADDGAFSLDFMASENKDVAKWLFRCRELRLKIFIAIPHIRWMAPVIKEHRSASWDLLQARGQVLLHKLHRADYDRTKPSWRKQFAYQFPEIPDPWFQVDYRQAKRDRIRGREVHAAVDEDPEVLQLDVLQVDALARRFQAAEILAT